MNIWNQTSSIFKFLGLPLSLTTREFLLNHTEKDMFTGTPKVWNTFRNPKEAPFHWKTKLPSDRVMEVQRHCQTAMRLWGYRMATKKDLLSEYWNPLTKWLLH